MMTSYFIFPAIILATVYIYVKKYLTLAGTILTAVMAIAFYTKGGSGWLAPPLTFFILSTIWTRILGVSTEEDKTRKFAQVFANGGLALLLVFASFFIKMPYLSLLFTTVFASAAADTWATELGGKFGGKPISLRTFKRTTKGESGAVSLIGTLASALGAFSVAIIAGLFKVIAFENILLITVAGLAGSLTDSLIGAWMQVIWINKNGDQYEDITSSNAETYTKLRGLSFINNDAVNFLSTFVAVVVTLFLIQYFR